MSRPVRRSCFAALAVALVAAASAPAGFVSSTVRAEEDDVARAIGKFREQVAKAEGAEFVARMRERSGGRAIHWLGSNELTIVGAARIDTEGGRLAVREFRIEAIGEARRRLASFDGETLRVADFQDEVVHVGEADWKALLGEEFGDLFLAVAGLPRDDRTLQLERIGVRTIGVRRMLRFAAWLETPQQTEQRLKKRPFRLAPADDGGAAFAGPAKILTVGLDPESGDLYRLEWIENRGPQVDARESVRAVTLAFDPLRLTQAVPEDRLSFEVPERFPQESVDWSDWSWDREEGSASETGQASETDASGGREPSVETEAPAR